MESDKIEKLLEAYFDGNTSLEEEKALQEYFNSEKIAEHLQQYKPIFMGLRMAKQERTEKVFTLSENKTKTKNTWWYSVAASLVVAFGVGSFFFSQPHLSQEEQEALAAFEDSKKAMMLLSENLNKGTEQLTFVGQFGKTTDKIFE